MLPNGPDVENVVFVGGLGENMKPGSVLIDMSSINPSTSVKIAKALAERGVDMLDAPVSGGQPGAEAGTLSFMVGGKQEIFDKNASLMRCMGTSVVHCGDIGTGNTTKLANQIIVAVNIAAVSEAFMLAKRAGVDPEQVFQAIKGGLAGSAVMNAKVPMILSGNKTPGFKLGLHIKDLNNAIDAGHTFGSPMLLSSMVMEMMRQMDTDGLTDCDHSVISKFYEKLTGVEFSG
jgi:2-hydroxy-3-oxopropionate reductase